MTTLQTYEQQSFHTVPFSTRRDRHAAIYGMLKRTRTPRFPRSIIDQIVEKAEEVYEETQRLDEQRIDQ